MALALNRRAARGRGGYPRPVNLFLLAFACGEPEPVLQAVERRSTPEEVAARRAAAELRASPENLVATYRKADGVYVDVRFLGGRRYDGVRAEIEAQLGAVLEERPSISGGREIVFERGTVRLVDDRIQMIDVPLPRPLRRSEALGALGFPPATGDYKELALEYRLVNEWGFRRLRFVRTERESEEIARVQAWKFTDEVN